MLDRAWGHRHGCWERANERGGIGGCGIARAGAAAAAWRGVEGGGYSCWDARKLTVWKRDGVGRGVCLVLLLLLMLLPRAQAAEWEGRRVEAFTECE